MSFAGPASAANNFGGFEIDGDLTASAGATDWNNAAPGMQSETDPIVSDPTVFSGSKEDNPDGWRLKTGAPGKDDIGDVYEWHQVNPADNHDYVFFAFERASDVGSVNFVVELNQQPNHDNGNNIPGGVPTRTKNDLRFNVTQVGNNPSLTADGVDVFDGTNYVPVTLPAGVFASAVNQAPITNPVNPTDPVAAANGGQIPVGQFAEFGFDVTAISNALGGGPCNIPPFKVLNSRSRASDVNNAEVKDFIHPIDLNLSGSCFDLTIQKFKDNGTTPLKGATFTVDPNPNTGTGPALTVTDGGANDPGGPPADGVIEFPDATPLPVGSNYTVTEQAPAPEGYLVAAPQSTTGALSFHSQTLQFTDPLGSVKFTKLSNSAAVAGAQFDVIGTSGAASGSTTHVTDNGTNDSDSTAGAIWVKGLKTGDYKIVETDPPSSLYSVDPAQPTFTISDATPNPSLNANSNPPTFSDPLAPVNTFDAGVTKDDGVQLDAQGHKLPVSVGGTLTYTINVSNEGNVDTGNKTVHLTDPIPASISSPVITGGAGWDCSASVGNSLDCTYSTSIPVGGKSTNVTVSGTVTSAAITNGTSGTITNTATISMAGDANANNNTSTVQTPVVEPDLQITKASSIDPAIVGAAFNYTLTVKNVGDGPTTGTVTVTDTVDNSLTINSVSGADWTCNTAGQTVTCTLKSPPAPLAANATAGDITINVTPKTAVAKPPGLTNTGTVATANDPNAANNSSSVTIAVKNAPASPAVAFVESCGPPQSITVNMSNVGGTAETFDITKPDGTHENVVVPANTPVANPVVRTYTLTGGNTVQVTAPDLVPTPQHDTFSLNCGGGGGGPIPPPGSPNLTLAKSSVPASGSTVQRGDSVTYTLSYANTGTAAATSTIASDPLPADENFVSATSGGTYDSTTRTVTWALNSVAAGASGTVSFVATVASTATDGETLTNVATIGAAGLAPVQSNPVTLTVSVPATPVPTLAIVKAVDKKTAEYGDTLTYTFTVTAGGANQTGVTVTDVLPDGTAYVPASATCSTNCSGTFAAGVVTWAIGDMAQGDTVTLTFQVTITKPAPDANGGIPPETIPNVGTVSSTQVDPTDSNKVQTQVVAVLGEKNVVPPKKPTTKPEPAPLPFTGLPIPLVQTLVLSSLMIVTGLWLTRPRRRRPSA